MAKFDTKIVLMALGCVLLCEMAGIVGAIFTMPAIPTWYATLNKPSFNPPDWVFGPAWTILYALMGIALFMIWQKGLKKPAVRNAVNLFAVQLILNVLWSVGFFGMHSPLYGMIIIAVLWLILPLMTIEFYKISRNAGLLLVPYFLWVSFASLLNLAVLMMNP